MNKKNMQELTTEDLVIISTVLRTVSDMNVLPDLNLRPIADRALWTFVNGITIKK